MAAPSTPEQFTGHAAFSKEEWSELKPWSYAPKKWSEDDVDIKIICCGVCGSDIHVLRSGWGPTVYPAVVGHEIVGIATRVGANVSHIKVGDRVGFGAQAGSCRQCRECKLDWEQYCEKGMIGTYQGKWEDGSISQGGYANYFRGKGHFAIPIPENMLSEVAAPLLCAGVTTYSPLKNENVGPGSTVGVVGIGGLGHLGLQWSVALGADTYALSHSAGKKADATKMGIPEENFLIVSNHNDAKQKYSRKFDVILCTSFQNDLPIDFYLSLLRPRGKFILVGLPENPLPAFRGGALISRGVSFGGSLIGSPKELREMFELAASKGVKPWVEVRPMETAAQTVKDMDAGKARYRYVLSNEDSKL